MLAGGPAAVADATGPHGSPGRPPRRADSPVADPRSVVGGRTCAAAGPQAGLRLGEVAPAGEPSLVVSGPAAVRSPAPSSLHAAAGPQAEMLAAAVRSAHHRLLAGANGATAHMPASAQGKSLGAVQIPEAIQGSAAAAAALKAGQPARSAPSQATAAAQLQRQDKPGRERRSRHSLWGRWVLSLGSLMGFGRVRAVSSGEQLAAGAAGAEDGSASVACCRCPQPCSCSLRDLACQLQAESWLQALCCE